MNLTRPLSSDGAVKQRKVLLLTQIKNKPAIKNETLYLYDICNKEYKSQSGIKIYQ